jgi:hypothetical protein
MVSSGRWLAPAGGGWLVCFSGGDAAGIFAIDKLLLLLIKRDKSKMVGLHAKMSQIGGAGLRTSHIWSTARFLA